jgi:hypothetical protein
MTWRVMALLWAALQFALPGASLVADARLERASLDAAGSHVESGSSNDCPPVHRDECALCQVLSRFAQPAVAPELPVIAGVVRPSAAAPVEPHADRSAASASLPRAPPPVA